MPLEPVWNCPTCRGALDASSSPARLTCTQCGAEYGAFGGIPDLRVDRPAWIDIDEDREAAARLDRDFRSQSLEAMVRAVFASQPGRSQQQIDMRTRQVLISPSRLRTQLEGWLDIAAAIDATRALHMRQAGFRVHTQCIPAEITPKNRLLLAEPLA